MDKGFKTGVDDSRIDFEGSKFEHSYLAIGDLIRSRIESEASQALNVNGDEADYPFVWLSVWQYTETDEGEDVFVIQRLRFLTDDEFGSLADQLENGRSDTIIANELLVILDRDCPETARKFIACLLEEKEHRAEAIGLKTSVLSPASFP
eukprot:Em0013g682a